MFFFFTDRNQERSNAAADREIRKRWQRYVHHYRVQRARKGFRWHRGDSRGQTWTASRSSAIHRHHAGNRWIVLESTVGQWRIRYHELYRRSFGLRIRQLATSARIRSQDKLHGEGTDRRQEVRLQGSRREYVRSIGAFGRQTRDRQESLRSTGRAEPARNSRLHSQQLQSHMESAYQHRRETYHWYINLNKYFYNSISYFYRNLQNLITESLKCVIFRFFFYSHIKMF